MPAGEEGAANDPHTTLALPEIAERNAPRPVPSPCNRTGCATWECRCQRRCLMSMSMSVFSVRTARVISRRSTR
jgi:hypothetical protein